MNSFILKRIKSIGYASKGAYLLLRSEPSIQVQALIGLAVTGAGFWFRLSPTEWIIQCLTITMVMAVEGLNTAIEKLADFIHPNYHKEIGLIKDVAAGSVFIIAMGAITAGILIYYPKIF